MERNSGILLIDKPSGMTSFDVIARLRKKLHISSMGHSGTLDPNATGLLVILVNKATKILPYMQKDTKVYHAELKLGIKTDTGDIWGNIIEEKDFSSVTEKEIRDVFAGFIGNQKQLPPMVSAIKHNGKKLYEYARENIEIEREERDICIDYLNIIRIEKDIIEFEAKVSSGTYIRTLCEDIAERLNTVGTMASLRRLECGNFSISDACKIEDISIENLPLIDIKNAMNLPYYEYLNTADIFNGRNINIESDEEKILIGKDNVALAVYRKEDDCYHCERGLW